MYCPRAIMAPRLFGRHSALHTSLVFGVRLKDLGKAPGYQCEAPSKGKHRWRCLRRTDPIFLHPQTEWSDGRRSRNRIAPSSSHPFRDATVPSTCLANSRKRYWNRILSDRLGRGSAGLLAMPPRNSGIDPQDDRQTRHERYSSVSPFSVLPVSPPRVPTQQVHMRSSATPESGAFVRAPLFASGL